MISYSIIIPHKNSSTTIIRLLDSIPENINYEIIIIDDNSELHHKKSLSNIVRNQEFKLIFSNESIGAGAARNIGLSNATGKWLLFADSDDYYSKDIDTLLTNYKDSHADIIYFGCDSIDDKGNQSYRHERYMNLVSNYIKDSGKEDALRYLFTPPWSKMIRKDLVLKHNILFDKVLASNDIMFSLRLASCAKSILATNKILYIITLTKGSIINTINKEYFNSKFLVALTANNFLRSINKHQYQQSILYFLAMSYRYGFKYMFFIIYQLIKNRSNILIGMNKIFNITEVMKQRENKEYTIRRNEK